MTIGVEAAGFIGASVTLILVIVFMILMVILVRQCLQYLAKRNALREQMEQQSQLRNQQNQRQRRRLSVTEPVPATFDWHHSIKVEGTPPPTYIEAEQLPALEKDKQKEKKSNIDDEVSIKGNIDNKIDAKIENSGTTPLITNGFEGNRSNSLSGRDVVEVAIAVEPSRVQSPPKSTSTTSSQLTGREAQQTSPEGDVEFTTGYTQFVAP